MKTKHTDIIVIGAGAAGLMAAISASSYGKTVRVFERNSIPGKKLLITGKGRCNITNDCNIENIIENTLNNPKFLYSSLNEFSSQDIINFFNSLGLKTKTERGNRVFPVSDRSQDVVDTLYNYAKNLGAIFEFDARITDIRIKNNRYEGIYVNKDFFSSNSIIIATGGLSYPLCGSTGDGYEFAKKMGHSVTQLSPGLCALESKQAWVKELMGLTLKNVNVKVLSSDKVIHEEFGEMLFTHFGVSGPIILTISSMVAKEIANNQVIIAIDLKPALNYDKLQRRILRDFKESINKDFKNSLDNLLPKKIIPIIIKLSGVDPDKKVNSITKEERKKLLDILKNLKIEIINTRPITEAIVTKGGISLDELDSSTLESKKVKGVFFAGEILDLDALTGGYNLTIAFSTGYKAGITS